MTMRALPGGNGEARERRQSRRPRCRWADTGHALRAFGHPHGARDDVARRRRKPVRVGVAGSRWWCAKATKAKRSGCASSPPIGAPSASPRYSAKSRTTTAAPTRIRNVRLFDPKTSALTAPVSVLVNGKQIAAVEPVDSPATPGEVTIDGAGGTLIAGMYEMHGHLGQDDALLNVLAGITSVRDMGNDNAVLDSLVRRIESGEIAGPHVIRSGFIEGKSPFSANNGIVVDSQEKALDAVRWYGARGYWQIKIYNSMNPAWVPAMVEEAHRLGMRVAGHVPAFATADQMIEAGYDEMTHINQFVLGWVIAPGEDTRTLFRLTALKRLPALDLNSAKVQHTIDLMAKGKKAIDPTLGIHENLAVQPRRTSAARRNRLPGAHADRHASRRDESLDRYIGAGRRSSLPPGVRKTGGRCPATA